MDVGPNVVAYLAGLTAIALIVGMAIGHVLKAASARRQIAPLEDENKRLKSELTAFQERAGASHDEEPRPAQRRITVTELVAILGAVGTLISTLAALHNNYQGKTITELKEKVAAAESKQKAAETDLDTMRKSTRALLGVGIEKWTLDKKAVPTQKPKRPEPFQVSDWDVTGSCADPRLPLTYNGSGPAIVHCSRQLILQLPQPTRILLVREDASQ